MTIYGMDSSHYDEPLASRDELSFYTHKCTDGAKYYMDAEYQAALNAAKSLGIPILGAYHVLWDTNVVVQMDWFFDRVNVLTPWWKSVPFMWQLDCEPFNYNGGKPSKASIDIAANYLVAKYGVNPKCIINYAPEWAYHDILTGLTWRLWASSYVSGSGPYKTLYPGDNSIRWTAYSGQVPLFLQYTSSAVIAGQTTCDANAYKGTEQDLINYLIGDVVTADEFLAILSDPRVAARMKQLPWQYTGGGLPDSTQSALWTFTQIYNFAKDAASNQIDYNLLADVIVSKLPTGALTKDDVKAAIIETIKVG
jgi:hypothetical protein